MDKPTEKQQSRIQRLINYRGVDFVRDYFQRHFPNGKFEEMTKVQAQKIITGLVTYEKHPPITGVVGRDIPFTHSW